MPFFNKLPSIGSSSTLRPKTPRGERNHMFKDPLRHGIVMVLGEFCGTFMFLLMAFIGTQTALNTNIPNDPTAPLRAYAILFVAASFGMALAVNVWIFYRVTGGLFNPAVTLGLFLVGVLGPIRAIIVLITQTVAAICAAAVADGLLPGPLTVGNQLKNGTNVPQGVFLEMFLTAQLVLTVYFLAVEKHRATFLAPIGIGMAAFIAHLAGTNYDGTSINPARSFGPACIQGFPGHHWIFWVGPFLGALLSYVVYRMLRWLEYETTNPRQDAADPEAVVGSDNGQFRGEKAEEHNGGYSSHHRGQQDGVEGGQVVSSGADQSNGSHMRD